MTSYYLDIETTGFDPKFDKIITIQYQQLDIASGKPIGNLIILKEWESSEKEILKKFIVDTQIGHFLFPHYSNKLYDGIV